MEMKHEPQLKQKNNDYESLRYGITARCLE